MKRSEIRAFVEGYFRYNGARIEPLARDLIRVTRESPSATSGRERTRLLAFGPRAQRAHAGAELVAVGSASLNRLIGEAVDKGRYVLAYRRPPEGDGRSPDCAALPEIENWHWATPQPAYRPVYLFVYIAEYHTLDVADDVEFIAYDPARRQIQASPESVLAALEAGVVDPPSGWAALPAMPGPEEFTASLQALDRRLQRRARKVKEAAASEIARETANIEAYYRQLIHEARHPVGRTSLTTEEEGDRVRALQLDWKRRVQEVQRFWEAYGDVRLCAVAALMEPCWSIALVEDGRTRSKTSRIHALADYAGGRFWELRCAACGDRLPKEAAALNGTLICRAHRSAGSEREEDPKCRE